MKLDLDVMILEMEPSGGDYQVMRVETSMNEISNQDHDLKLLVF